MAIIGPEQLPLVLKVDSNPLKRDVVHRLGHPHVLVELSDAHFETSLRRIGDFVAEYFPLEEKYAFFMTQPLRAEYPIPEDAYWIREVSWDPATTRIDDIFGAESFLFNIGNISGIQNILTDFHLLQHYRKFSQRVLSTEGQWEFKRDFNKIRLFPVPRGSFPVVIVYLPSVTKLVKPSTKQLVHKAFLADMKMTLGNIRKKYSGFPGPDGGQVTLDGQQMYEEGYKEWEEAKADAMLYGQPLPIWLW